MLPHSAQRLAAPSPLSARPEPADFIWRAEAVLLLVVSPDGALLRWNEGARRGVGSHADLREGMPVWSLLAENSASLLRDAMREQRAEPFRALLTFSDGERFAFTLSCAVYAAADEWWVFGEPLVERQARMQQELLELTDELARTNRERSRLAAELERTLDELRTSHWQIRKIQEYLPICAVCHKVSVGPREDGRWETLTRFLSENGLDMTHGYCPECHAAALAEIQRMPPPR